MDSFASLASGRRSIRKYQDKDIPLSEIQEFIRIAVTAPSGCNSQCWRFVAIKDKAVIKQIADAVIRKVDDILSIKAHELSENYITSKRKMVTFFTAAPVVVAVFMTRLEYYDPVFESALKQHGYTDEDIMRLVAHPDLLSIGAAVQNLLLAVHEKGYGACWMNEPAIAGEEIGRILGMPGDSRFISLIPIGVPNYIPREKNMKDFDDVFTAIC